MPSQTPTRALRVYLDTSDYSRFGDVIRGKGDVGSKRLYESLLKLKADGRVEFLYSMTVVSELFQFDQNHPATTANKAEAVESLCGQSVFYWPMKSLAFDIAQALPTANSKIGIEEGPISRRSQWHPNVAQELGDLKQILEAQIQAELSKLTFKSRQQRRAAETKARKFNLARLGPEIIAEVCKIYKLDRREVARSIVPTLEGKISSEEGARRMFSAIARPRAFVANYFSSINDDRSLPDWISNVGIAVQTSLIELREKLDRFDQIEVVRDSPSLIAASADSVIEKLFKLAVSEIYEFGVDPGNYIFEKASGLYHRVLWTSPHPVSPTSPQLANIWRRSAGQAALTVRTAARSPPRAWTARRIASA